MRVKRQRERLGRRERKKLEVEQRIREAAVRLFREKGYAETTVEEIAELADVSKGTFFNYFGRKDGLLEALTEDLVGELFGALGPEEEWTGTSREQLERLFVTLADLVARDADLSRVMMIEHMRRFWLRTEADPLETEFEELVREVLGRGREAGEIDAGADLAAGAQLLGAAYTMTMVDWLKSGGKGRGYRRSLRVKFDLIFRGLGAGQGGTA